MVVVGLERVIAIMVGGVYCIVSTTKGYKHDTINTKSHIKGKKQLKKNWIPSLHLPALGGGAW
jgi:hypothetical protein